MKNIKNILIALVAFAVAALTAVGITQEFISFEDEINEIVFTAMAAGIGLMVMPNPLTQK